MSGRSHLSAGWGFVLSMFLATGVAAQDRVAPIPQTIQFNRDVRPILSENCFTCHGPDKTHRVTAFHFDVEETAKQEIGGGRFAIVPGDLEKSQLIQRVTHPDESRRMPPASTGKPRLSDHEIALLKEWIRQGAKWEKFWSFEPPVRPALPKGRRRGVVAESHRQFRAESIGAGRPHAFTGSRSLDAAAAGDARFDGQGTHLR